jgi:DNA polymerase|tara:strand:+ start:2901 stop:4556 length:1656 start_codon:yes stop_codon:yes gene_type:complete
VALYLGKVCSLGVTSVVRPSFESIGVSMSKSFLKDRAGHRVMLKMCKPRKPTKHNKSEWHDDPADYQKLYAYCKQDVVVEEAIHNETLDLHPHSRDTWLLNQKINERGIPVDRELIENILATEKVWHDKLIAEFYELTGVESPRKLVPTIEWLRARGVEPKSLAKDHVVEVLKQDMPDECRRVLEIRQLTSRTSTKKYTAMLNRVEEDGRIRGEHLFHGASTGRFAGSGVQIQNLPRPKHSYDETLQAIETFATRDPDLVEMMHGNLSEIAVSCIRPSIKAPEGKKLIVCDFTGIEARVLGWLANCAGYQETFRAGGDLYVEMAKRIYSTQTVTSANRFVGKIAILGLGYGMGAQKFFKTAVDWGAVMTEEEAREIVQIYRTTFNEIQRFWYALDDAAKGVVETNKPQTVGRIRFSVDGNYLFANLPSGRRIAYRDPQVRNESTPIGVKPALSYMGVNSQTRQWERKRTYGGKLCENIVQAAALDLLVAAIPRLESLGYETVFHVHDEIVCEVPEKFGSYVKVEKEMARTPPWAKGCYISAEGFESERYWK